LVEAVQLDLLEDYDDVTDPERDAEMLAARAELLRELPAWSWSASFGVAARRGIGLGEMVERLVQMYYSGPHWRRAAKVRARQVSQEFGKPVTAVIMGHTHWPDEFSWTEAGADCCYVNSGSWRRQAADIVVIEDGTVRLFKRDWRDEWPDLA